MLASCFSRIAIFVSVLTVWVAVSRAVPATNRAFGFTQSWKYQIQNLDGMAWPASDYDDALWPSGGSLLFIEDALLPEPKTTPLPPREGGAGPLRCYYFRTSVLLSNTPAITSLVFSNLIDDGAVFYLNGVEVKRVGMGDGPVTYTTLASREVGDATAFDVFSLSGPVLARLREGDNVIAAEVHQATAASSDVVFGCSLTTVVDPESPTFVWLVSPTTASSIVLGSTCLVEASVSQLFGGVAKVEFLANGVKFGEATTPPYTATWIIGSLGSHTLTAVAYNSDGISSISPGVSVFATRPALPKLVRGPYLQTGTPHSVVVCWRTDLPSTSQVVYGTNLAHLDQSVFTDSYTTNHALQLTNLHPATRYYYALNTDAGQLAPPHLQQYYQSAPLPGDTPPIRVWAIGDAGAGDSNQTAVRNAYYNFTGTNHTDVWLQLGDNAYPTGTDSQLQTQVFTMYSNLLARTVTWPTLGNHDTANSSVFTNTYPYFDAFVLPTRGEAGGAPSGCEQYYSFDYGNVHFICLDSMTSNLATNGPMANWLRSDLAAATNLWLIAYWHHAPYAKGHRDSDTDPNMRAMRENFVPILEAAGVDLVLGGHAHIYGRSFLLNGHYGLSDTLIRNMLLTDSGGRATNGGGSYVKPLIAHAPHQGTVYAVVGCSGMLNPGLMNHPALFRQTMVLGSLCLQINSNRLDALFLRETGAIDDAFTIVKENMTNRIVTAQLMPNGSCLLHAIGVAGRVYTVEATDSLRPPQWRVLGSTRAGGDGVFLFTDPTSISIPQRFYRMRQ